VTEPGTAGGPALARCIACGPDVFAADHWGRAPLLTRGAELDGGFDDLLDPAAVDELVSRRGLRTPFLRMAKDGTVLPRSRFTRGGGAGASIDDQVADDLVLSALDDGATLVLQALHRTWPPLVAFGGRLAGELGHPVQINAYVTPPQNQGFAPHYDVHDVFVLQVSGRKRWVIHEPVVVDPLANQPWEQHRAAVAARAEQDDPLIDTVLAPGDALYLPRGTIHAAAALGETSIHLTVGVHPVTRFELVRRLLESAEHDPALRGSLPMAVDLADPAVLAPHLAGTLRALHARLDTADAAELAAALGELLARQTRPEPIGPLAQLDAAAALDEDTPLRLRSGGRVRVERAGDGLVLHGAGRTLELPAAADAGLKRLLGGETVPAAEVGPDVARRLLRAGVIVPG
jgi:ribosomal protein L16 Arg81 hydroxylase